MVAQDLLAGTEGQMEGPPGHVFHPNPVRTACLMLDNVVVSCGQQWLWIGLIAPGCLGMLAALD